LDADELADPLERHLPVLRYDSHEPYSCDSAAEWTDNPTNELCRADGTVVAAAAPPPGQRRLSLALLRHSSYADPAMTPVKPGDRIADRAHDYGAQARAIHARPGYANRVYGHSATGTDGRIWIAYWFFYFYNDYNLIGELVGAGLHEGDWEMIQLRLDPSGAPDLVVCARHAGAAAVAWADVERVGDQPVVYPARGSHASYLEPGVHWNGYWFDHADGRRAAPPMTLEIVRDGDPDYDWISWPGLWGGTVRKHHDPNPFDDSSPLGPGAHPQWHDPHTLLELARDHAAHELPPPPADALPPAPEIDLARDGSGLAIGYRTEAPEVAALAVTVDSPDDELSPTAHLAPVSGPAGTASIAADLNDEQSYDVHVSVATPAGHASASTAARLARVRG
jgi:hypothetical protein